MLDKTTLILIPAYNEAETLGLLLEKIKDLEVPVDILVINDCSLDETGLIAAQKGADVLNLPLNLGYGAALQTGYKYALRKGYDYVIQMDGDGQHDPQFIPALMAEIKKGEVDVVIGSRFLVKGSYKVPLLRRWGMVLFGTIASYCTNQKISDPTSGFQAIDREVLNFFVSDVYPVDYPDADVLIMLVKTGFTFKEVPVIMHQHSQQHKSIHSGFLKPLYYIFKMFLSIFVTLLRRDSAKELPGMVL
ncbi:MAG: glycosyltransferase family 2 protein [Candidatus Schekmanbacteria bacterium]|nr:glycosyltransferase family 2 protein [Candidatus Schekmanbacteria bacterium]